METGKYNDLTRLRRARRIAARVWLDQEMIHCETDGDAAAEEIAGVIVKVLIENERLHRNLKDL